MNYLSLGSLTAVILSMLICQDVLAQSAVSEPTAAKTTTIETTALDDYVHKVDPAFDWSVERRVERPTHTELVLDLTSQTWRKKGEVNRTTWHHWLTIVVPREAISDAAMLFITGGSNDKGPPEGMDERLLKIALVTRSVVAELKTVPNQPLSLNGETRERYEDDLLAASWVEFMKSGDPTWIVQLAMTKSAAAAMTAVQESLSEEESGDATHGWPAIKRFTVSGASKRGWTTWLTAVVDPRVVAIAPIVIDVLNIAPSMRHHHASYGFWSDSLGDYERAGLAESIGKPKGAAIRSIVDPYVYRNRLTLPKCLINAAGDQFFLPDSSRYYFDDLVGEKHLSYTPNASHSLQGSNALDTLVAFHASVVDDLERSTVTWTGGHDAAKHTIRCTAKPIEAVLWRAVNPKARDFRLETLGAAFKATPLEPNADGTYHVAIEAPAEGWSATFVRFAFDIGAPTPWRISTPVWVAPDVEPFAEAD